MRYRKAIFVMLGFFLIATSCSGQRFDLEEDTQVYSSQSEVDEVVDPAAWQERYFLYRYGEIVSPKYLINAINTELDIACGSDPSNPTEIDKYLISLESGEPISQAFRALDITRNSPGPFSMMLEEDGKWGYVDAAGNIILDPIYDRAGVFFNGQAGVTIDDVAYLINEQGEILREFPQYTNIGLVVPGNTGPQVQNYKFPSFDSNDYYYSAMDDKVNRENKLIMVHQTHLLDFSGELLIGDTQDGYRNIHFELVDGGAIQAQAYTGTGFDESTKYVYRLYDIQGNLISKTAYSQMDFYEGYSFVMEAETYETYLIDATGNIYSRQEWYEVLSMHDGVAAVDVDMSLEDYSRLYGYIDGDGEYVIEPRFQRAGRFSEGYAVVSEDFDTWALIDKSGHFVFEPTHDYRYIYPVQNGITTAVISYEPKGSRDFSPDPYSSYRGPVDGSKRYSYSLENSVVIDTQGNVLYDQWPAVWNLKYGFIAIKEVEVIDTYRRIKYGLLSPQGDIIFEPLYSSITIYNENYIYANM